MPDQRRVCSSATCHLWPKPHPLTPSCPPDQSGRTPSPDDEEWTCPKPGCDLDADGHDLALAVEHIYEIEPEVARDVADGTIRRMEGLL